MINIASAEWLFSLLMIICVYYISVMVNGAIQAFIAAKLGDRTAIESGYANFSPLVYFDPLIFLFLVILHVGWSPLVPFNPYNIDHNNRTIKLLIFYATESIISITIAIIALITSIISYGSLLSFKLAEVMFYPSALAQYWNTESYELKLATYLMPNYSSIHIVLAILLMSFVFINIYLAAFSIIENGFRFALVLGAEKQYSYMKYSYYLTYFAPLIVIFFFMPVLKFYLFYIVISICKLALSIGIY